MYAFGRVPASDAPGPSATLALRAEPSPADAHARIVLDVAEPGPVRLSVVDRLGRELAVLVDGNRSADTLAADLDARRLAPGVYLVRVQTTRETRTVRLTVAR